MGRLQPYPPALAAARRAIRLLRGEFETTDQIVRDFALSLRHESFHAQVVDLSALGSGTGLGVRPNNNTRIILTPHFYPGIIIPRGKNMHSYTAFQKNKRVAKGTLEEIALKLKKRHEEDQTATFLIFDDESGRTLEFLDFSGTNEQVLQRIQVYLPREESKGSGPGRPKLGVVAREVSLLPRHWEWLAQQPGGASVTLRKLVEEKAKSGSGSVREAIDATYRFLSVAAGDLPGYEEALRALYAKNQAGFEERIAGWPKDIREHGKKMADKVWG